MQPSFDVTMRGYDRLSVDALMAQGEAALATPDQALRASARTAIRDRQLPITLRGYDRRQVDDYLEALDKELASGGF